MNHLIILDCSETRKRIEFCYSPFLCVQHHGFLNKVAFLKFQEKTALFLFMQPNSIIVG